MRFTPEQAQQMNRETMAKRRALDGILVTRWIRGKKQTIRLTRKLKAQGL